MKLLNTKRSFRKEFRRQIKMAVIAAIGFTIAYAWKETILNIMESLAINIANAASLGYSPLFMPLLTTLLGVVFIFILSKIFKE